MISDSPTRRGIDIYSKDGAPVVAANDGVITKIGENKQLGKFIVLRDAYGNEYTYAGLGEIADVDPGAGARRPEREGLRPGHPGRGRPKPKVAASKTTRTTTRHNEAETESDRATAAARTAPGMSSSGDEAGSDGDSAGPTNTEDSRERLFALPNRTGNGASRASAAQLDDLLGKGMPGYETFKSYFSGVLQFDDKTMDADRCARAPRSSAAPSSARSARPIPTSPRTSTSRSRPPAAAPTRSTRSRSSTAGSCSRRPRSTAPPARTRSTTRRTVGQVLLASKSQLQRQVLADPRIEIYSCGRDDIATGQIDRRVLAMLEYLVARGFRLTITSLKCGHSVMTTSGNVSAHSTGDAVDIAQVNGIPILGNQGRGSITEAVINDLLKLQGSMAPAQIISLMEMGGPTFAMGDHADHIHVGYTPDGDRQRAGSRSAACCQPEAVGQAARPDRRARPADRSDQALQVLAARQEGRPGEQRPPRRVATGSRRPGNFTAPPLRPARPARQARPR